MRTAVLMAGIFAAAIAVSPAAAEKPGGPNPHGQGMTAEEAVGTVFTEIEKRIIRDYFGQHGGAGGGEHGKSKKMPPGLAKRNELPPGLQMQIVKNGTLPPGLAKRDLPPDLVLKLPALKKGLERKIVGNDVVLIQTATGVVLDVLRGVLNNR